MPEQILYATQELQPEIATRDGIFEVVTSDLRKSIEREAATRRVEADWSTERINDATYAWDVTNDAGEVIVAKGTRRIQMVVDIA